MVNSWRSQAHNKDGNRERAMKIKHWSKTGLIFIFSLMLLTLASSAFADGVKYLYDDIGQLKKVVDEEGNVASYNYDVLGNLLSIARSAGGIQRHLIFRFWRRRV